MSMISPICKFLSGMDSDDQGRMIFDYHAFNVLELEHIHDYIQWAFPTPTASAFNDNAPVLTIDDITYISRSASAQEYLAEMTWLMIEFYHQYRGWLVEHDHNHLRISRILESLNLLLNDEMLLAKFYVMILEQVSQSPNTVNAETLRIWQFKIDF